MSLAFLNRQKQKPLLPVPTEDRKVTDKIGLIMFGSFLLILIPCLAYTLSKADIRKLTLDYDSCGNFCGELNEKIDGVICSGKDYTKKPFSSYNIFSGERKCTSDCPPGYFEKNGTCLDDSGYENMKLQKLWASIQESTATFFITSLITIAICFLTLLLYKFAPEVIVWGILGLSVALALVITALLWIASGFFGGSLFTPLATISTIFTLIMILILCVLFKKIQLIILLYKETTRVIFSLPLLLCLPLITLFFKIIITLLTPIVVILSLTAGDFVSNDSNNYTFELNGVVKFTIIFTCIIAVLSLEFFTGCQYMVIAASVSGWFFKKNKSYSLITTGIKNTVKFHLGTIALGSMILLVMRGVKIILKTLLCNNKYVKCVCCCCCCTPECVCPCCSTYGCTHVATFLKYLTKNAYIETAIRGKSFMASGKQAANLLTKNALSMIALNSVGDFVLFMTKFVLIVLSTGIAYTFFMDKPYLTGLIFLINLIIVTILFSIFETIVDTLFICFCEDKALSNGTSRPYHMSKNLMLYIKKSEEIYNKENSTSYK